MDLSNDAYAMFFFPDFLYKSICCGYLFELHRQVSAIQTGTHNICLFEEVDKKYTCCNLKTMELLDCALIGVCAVARSNMVVIGILIYCNPFKILLLGSKARIMLAINSHVVFK